jgi:hypothetical protein
MARRQETPGAQNGPMSIEPFQDMAMNVTYNIATVVSMPVEMILYPFHGTRYFSPPMFLFSVILMTLMSAFSSVAGSVGQMIPFVRGPAGVFGIASMTKLFFAVSFIHGLRIWRLMLRPYLELNSLYEGPPLPCFKLLPWGNSFWFRRIVYEPAAVFAVSMVLANLYVIQAPLLLYLQGAAFMLAMKQFVAWFKFWSICRDLMDAANVGPIVARLVDNKATEEDKARIHMASLPQNLPPDIHKATVAQVARAYGIEEQTPQPKRNPESGFSGLRFIFLTLVVTAFVCLAMCGATIRRTITRLGGHANAQTASARRSPFHWRISPAAVPQGPAFPALGNLSGHWQGQALLPERGMCTLGIDLEEKDRQFSAYSSLMCFPLAFAQRKLNQNLAVLTGTAEKLSVNFHVLKTMGGTPRACTLTSLALTPFGPGVLAAEWQDAPCKGGEILLRKAGR